ncbi:MAG: hypothetical protein JWO15_2087 [Sphingomonadales bacterium]|nr:hypothetical protein [Sphingomonadales bacterium]
MIYRSFAVALGATVSMLVTPVAAQMAGMDHDTHDSMPGMDMDMDMADTGAAPASGSGTSRLPAAEGMMTGLHLRPGGWTVMIHGYAWATYSDQGGPRGDDKAFVTSMAMVEGTRDLSATTRLQLRGMFSLDPLIGKRGYPNLFATGETANGVALVDRQHPHDLFMELSARVDTQIGSGLTAFVYGGPVAEPALGPSAFMHRASAQFNPEAPITHHWFDSTHIAFGVVTAGLSNDHWQLEGSAFRGREPDEARYDIETPKLDSYSIRGTWTPTRNWAASLSYGRLKSTEALHPDEDESRLIAVVAYADKRLAVTAAYGRKDRLPGRVVDAFLAEANWKFVPRHAVFGRVENVENDELFGEDSPLHDRPFRVTKATLGYAYTLPVGPFGLSLGGSASVYAKSAALDAAYGRAPKSFTLFAKLALGH